MTLLKYVVDLSLDISVASYLVAVLVKARQDYLSFEKSFIQITKSDNFAVIPKNLFLYSNILPYETHILKTVSPILP